jgi:hypothetical protein
MPECSVCRSTDIQRSRTLAWLRRWFKSKRTYRCRTCGHYSADVLRSSRAASSALTGRVPDLAEIDRAFE